MNEILIYKIGDSHIEVEVAFENETVWLNQKQLPLLFDKGITTINEHIKNIYSEKELEEFSTIRKSRIVQIEGNRKVEREVVFYNLDVIISVGYRVKSIQGTQFRQWATKRLNEYLIDGVSLNKKRLEQLQQTIKMISSSSLEDVNLHEAKGLLEIINQYTQSFSLLNDFDSNNLKEEKLEHEISYEIEYKEAVEAIDILKNELISKNQATSLFGNQKDQSFEGTLMNVVQTFDGNYLYQTIEEQAANLLYLIIKNHPFSDWNKRIGAFLFIWYLDKNKHRFKKSGELKINDNGLTTLALLVAQSNPSDKDLMIKLIVNLINER
ncbi:MAG: RhuM family protein [Fluviicola sp.]